MRLLVVVIGKNQSHWEKYGEAEIHTLTAGTKEVEVHALGLHDLKYVVNGKQLNTEKGKQVHTIAEYQQHLEADLKFLNTIAPGALLIFATTTPVPEGSVGRIAGDAKRYNSAAREVLQQHPGVLINDLFAFTLPHHSAWWSSPGNVHYKPVGFDAQGDEVARVILAALKTK